MHMLFRTLWQTLVKGRRGARLAVDAVARTRYRVVPNDVDFLRHMNNGKYLSIMDLGRLDLMERNGVWPAFQREGWYPVVVAQTISYRKSLDPGMRFTIESRIIGFDVHSPFLEQRFTRPGPGGEPEIYARAIVRARVLRRSGGAVEPAEIVEKLGLEPDVFDPLPEWIAAWAEATRLPSLRSEAPSRW